MSMTIKESILKVLESEKRPLTYNEVWDRVKENNFRDWRNAKTPADTISAQLGNFIRQNDTRVKRVEGERGFEYYLSKYEKELNLSEITEKEVISKNILKANTFQERDLHKLLSSYLKNQNTFSKTIFHEKSANSKDNYQKWIHPDMIGINFLNLKNRASNSLMKIINKADSFDLVSYELKREVKTDYELKQSFFQAVSNSSWSNYGYLVVFDIGDDLLDEIERLNQSFGIGVIELKSNPYESKVLFPSKYRELDFRTIDKLCGVNRDFAKFIEKTEMILGADDRYLEETINGFSNFCDKFFENDSEIEKYCKEKNIPMEEFFITEI